MRGRNRPKGQNPLSRVYESNGPDVKVRGTAHHVAEKYVTLARDAQSSGDYVAAEAYLQHAEHYFRIIAAAQEAQIAQRQAQIGGRPEADSRDDDDEDDDMSPLDDRFSMPARFEQPLFPAQQNAYPNQMQPAPGGGPQPHHQAGQGQRNDNPRSEHPRGDHQRADRYPRGNRLHVNPAPVAAPQPDVVATPSDVEQLPAFITGAGGGIPVAAPAGEGEADRFPLRRRRRRPGPRVTEGGDDAASSDGGEASVSAE